MLWCGAVSAAGRCCETPVEVRVRVDEGRVVTLFAGCAMADAGDAGRARIAAKVRHYIALGEDIVLDFMGKMHGTYRKETVDDHLRFELQLPAIAAGGL